MIKFELRKIFNFNILSLIIGTIGSISSILTVFITKWDVQINLKWLVFTIFISVFIILILSKIIYELKDELRIKFSIKANVIRYIPEQKTLLVKKTDTLGYDAMVSIFFLDESYEAELGKGYVINIQDQFIQIKLLEITEDFASSYLETLERIQNNDLNILNKIIIKNYIRYSLIRSDE